MRIDIITIFPEICEPYLNESILKRASKNGLVSFRCINPRDFTNDSHKTVDDSPYGGGPGMVLKPEPILGAVNYAFKGAKKPEKKRVILFSLRGKKFTQKDARRLSKYNHIVFICGRYEGVDERIAKNVADEEISIGDFVLSGGELPALTVSEALLRHVHGVLGKHESLEELKGSYPVYTRPPVVTIVKNGKKKRLSVPSVLMTGNHSEIEKWRKEQQTKVEFEICSKKGRG